MSLSKLEGLLFCGELAKSARRAPLKTEWRNPYRFESYIPYHQPVAKCSNAASCNLANRGLKSHSAVQVLRGTDEIASHASVLYLYVWQV